MGMLKWRRECLPVSPAGRGGSGSFGPYSRALFEDAISRGSLVAMRVAADYDYTGSNPVRESKEQSSTGQPAGGAFFSMVLIQVKIFYFFNLAWPSRLRGSKIF